MGVDKDLILKLRNASQAGFMDCKKALEANNNDIDLSIKWLRSKGIAKANNRNALKEATEGVTWAKKDESGVAILELNSETDFTSSNSQFLSLAEEIVDLVLSKKEANLESVLNLKMGNGETVSDNCLHLSSITGEKIILSKIQYFSIGNDQSASCYRHNNGKISALLIFDKKLPEDVSKGLAVHYAANNPKFLDVDSVDKSWIDSEKEVISDLLKKENKPEQFHAKIIEERIKKLLSSQVFLEQSYLYDSSKTIRNILDEFGAKVVSAVCYSLSSVSSC